MKPDLYTIPHSPRVSDRSAGARRGELRPRKADREDGMKERPILMSAPMVRAILDGSKTQTRRIWKMPSWAEWDLQKGGEKSGNMIPKDPENGAWYSVDEVACPYGKICDQLWVRETCRAEELQYAGWEDGVRYLADNAWRVIENTSKAADKWHDLASYGMKKSGLPECRTVPAIHMPRWASRIQLEITGIRVERLQDISEEDAMAEGVELPDSDGWVDYLMPNTQCCNSAKESYRTLWQSINGTGSWAANPWVWVVEFRRIGP